MYLTIRIKRQPNNPYALWESQVFGLEYRLLKCEKGMFTLFVSRALDGDEQLLEWWECTQAPSDALVRIRECISVGKLMFDHTVWKSEKEFIIWIEGVK